MAALRKPLPRSRFFTIPRIVVVSVSAVAVLMVPLARPRSAGAWAQVAAATAGQERYHERTFDVRGEGGKPQPSLERWVDGRRHALRFGRESFRATWGSDGKKSYRFWAESDYALVEKPRRGPTGPYLSMIGSIKSYSIEDLLQEGRARAVGEPEKVETPEGTRLVYVVEYFASAEKKDKDLIGRVRFHVTEGDPRIRRWELLSKDDAVVHYGELDYPDQIADEVFAFRPPQGTRIYDLDEGRAQLRKTIERGYGTKSVGGHSVTLRAVVGGTNRDLNVLWTGTPPNGDLQPPAKIAGLPVAQNRGLTILTNKVYEYIPAVEKLDYLPTHLAGMTVASKAPLPRKVTVTVPVFAPDKTRPVFDFEGRRTGYRSKYVGSVTYKDVPVLQVGPFYEYLDDLNLREPTRYEALVRDYGRKPKPIP